MKLKKVLLIGDSIREGYDKYLREQLKGVAEVSFPAENCRFAAYTLRNLHEWKQQMQLEQVDVVHWNAGLWDTLRLFGDGPLTPPEVYGDYIARIERRIELLFPGAKVIFATSTPVCERMFPEPEKSIRYNRDIEEYNRVALRALARFAVEIDDLYALLKDAPESLHSDMTHYYTPEGTRLIGGQVLRVVSAALEISARQTDDGLSKDAVIPFGQ